MNIGIVITYEELEDNLITKLDFLDENLNYPLSVYFATKNIIVWETIIKTPNTWCCLPYSRSLDVRIWALGFGIWLGYRV